MTDDRSQIPFLKDLLQHPRKHWAYRKRELRKALAKLGDKDSFGEIVNEMKNPDPAVQSSAIEDLTYVSGKDSIRELANLLDDGKRRAIPEIGYLPLCFEAVSALDHIVLNPPVHLAVHPMPAGVREMKKMPTQEDVEKWRLWWKENKSKYE